MLPFPVYSFISTVFAPAAIVIVSVEASVVITVPVNLIVIQDNQHGVTAFPDSAVIDDPTDAEPKAPEVKAEDDTLHPPHQTATGDDERKLHNVNKDGGEAAPDHMTTKVYLGGLR